MYIPQSKAKFYLALKICLLIFSFNNQNSFAQKATNPFKVNGFVDFNGYNDTRNFSTLTYNILLQLSKRVQYFSLTNHNGLSNSLDLANAYAEHNLRYKLTNTSPLDLTVQYVIRNGKQNDDLKFGFRWRLSNTKGIQKIFKKLNLFYAVNPMLVQFRHTAKTKYITQLEHVYNINLFPKINNRLYLSGFADQIIDYNNGNISFTWVTEHQLGYKLLNRFYIVLEYRFNQFLTDKNAGLGYGLEYKIKF